MRNNLIIGNRRTQTVAYEPTQAEIDREAARVAADVARNNRIDAALRDTPASANSVPALRAEVNRIKAYLRGE